MERLSVRGEQRSQKYAVSRNFHSPKHGRSPNAKVILPPLAVAGGEAESNAESDSNQRSDSDSCRGFSSRDCPSGL